MEVVPTLAGAGIVFEDAVVPLDVVPGTEAILIHVRNVDCAEWFRNGHGGCQFRYVLPIVFINSAEDCRVADHIVLSIHFEEDSGVIVGVGATLVLTEELPGLQSHEVGVYELNWVPHKNMGTHKRRIILTCQGPNSPTALRTSS